MGPQGPAKVALSEVRMMLAAVTRIAGRSALELRPIWRGAGRLIGHAPARVALWELAW